MRRFLILPLALLIACFVPVGAVRAEDPPACTLQVPAEVTATSPYTAVWPKFSNCQGVTATWTVYGYPTGAVKPLGTFKVVDGVSQGAFRFEDSDPVGRLKTITDGGANQPTFVVKFGSRITLKGERVSDLKIPLKGVVSRYVPSVNEFRRWAYRPVAVSYRDCLECPWQFLAMDKTDRYGVYSLGAVSYEARYYRVKVGATTTTWGQTSVPVHH